MRGRAVFALVVRFTVLPDHLQAFDALATDTLAQIARHEPDTLVYLNHQHAERPHERVFYECYRSEESFDAHEAQAHTIRFLHERSQYLAGPPDVWRLESLDGLIRREPRAR